ncbi:hypothetical protein R3W88_005265 [Solanum pinnatisectum]|uniref:Uncharacterized protein n=1 Tax=Solanum pinnatisectum TaxID=50273 RepID=A0AAV9KBN7_9SOLN|nr:hypothetical protein R3W88_005265 [Solanum pinnatisectum]
MQTKVPHLVLNDTKGSNDVDEENSLDNVALFDKSPQRDASSTLALFSTEGPMMSNTYLRITEIVYPIATGVPLLVPLVGCEVMLSNKHLEQDMPMRYLLSILVERFGGRRPFTTIAQYFEVNNSKFDESEHKGILVPISHLSEVLLENMIKILNVAANSASISFGDIIRCITFLNMSHMGTHLCHVNQLLSKNDATMSIILQTANRVSSLLLTNLTIPGDAHAYLNLEDKVLIGVGSIVINGPRPVIPKTTQYHIKGLYVRSKLISSTF